MLFYTDKQKTKKRNPITGKDHLYFAVVNWHKLDEDSVFYVARYFGWNVPWKS